MNAKKEKQYDDIIWWRARNRIALTEVMTSNAVHYRVAGKVLCGSRAKMLSTELVVTKDMLHCARCVAKLNAMLEELMQEEQRNYWLRPAAGEIPAEVPKVRTGKTERITTGYSQLGLDAELLPVGTGERVGIL